jgi:hypothetical protein
LPPPFRVVTSDHGNGRRGVGAGASTVTEPSALFLISFFKFFLLFFPIVSPIEKYVNSSVETHYEKCAQKPQLVPGQECPLGLFFMWPFLSFGEFLMLLVMKKQTNRSPVGATLHERDHKPN